VPRSVLIGRTQVAMHDTQLGGDADANVQITAGWVETPAGVLVPQRSQPAAGEALAVHHPGAVAFAVDASGDVQPVGPDDPMPVSLGSLVAEVDTDDLETAVTATNTRIGEVQASPTANTLLDRLKVLNTSVQSVLTDLQGKADTAEAQAVDSELPAAAAAADGAANPTAPAVRAANERFNGTGWDRARGNLGLAAVLASAARTSTTFSASQTNHNARGILLRIIVSAAPGGGETLTPYIQAPNGFSLAQFTAITTTTAGMLYVLYPGAVDADTLAEAKSCPLPRDWVLVMVHSAGGSWTYQADVAYIV